MGLVSRTLRPGPWTLAWFGFWAYLALLTWVVR